MIAELVTMNALRRRRNILLDGSLRNKEYYSQVRTYEETL